MEKFTTIRRSEIIRAVSTSSLSGRITRLLRLGFCLLLLSFSGYFTRAEAQNVALSDLLRLSQASESASYTRLQELGYTLFDQNSTESTEEKIYLSADGDSRITMIYPAFDDKINRSEQATRKPLSVQLMGYSLDFLQLQPAVANILGITRKRPYTDTDGLVHELYVLGSQNVEFISEETAVTGRSKRFKVVFR